MLLPTGVSNHLWIREVWVPKDSYPSWVVEAVVPCILVGELKGGKVPVFSPDGCLPDSVGAMIAKGRTVKGKRNPKLMASTGKLDGEEHGATNQSSHLDSHSGQST
jgi:hypothetical protein